MTAASFKAIERVGLIRDATAHEVEQPPARHALVYGSDSAATATARSVSATVLFGDPQPDAPLQRRLTKSL